MGSADSKLYNMKIDAEMQKRETQSHSRDYEMQYKQLLAQAKIAAKQHRIGEARMCAKQMVSIKKAQIGMDKQRGSLTNIQMHLNQMKMNKQRRDTMNKMTGIMKSMNSKSDIKRLQKDARDHNKASTNNKLMQELLEDAMEQMDEDDNKEESESQEDAIMKQIMDEIGLATADAMPPAPTHQPALSNNFTIVDRVNVDDIHLGINGVKRSKQ
jgi:hypothetical protein